MKTVDTEKEAKQIVLNFNRDVCIFLKYCPLIKETCNCECVCFEQARFLRINERISDDEGTRHVTKYRITEPYCGNAMFTETEIYINP